MGAAGNKKNKPKTKHIPSYQKEEEMPLDFQKKHTNK